METKIPIVIKYNIVFSIVFLNLILLSIINPSMMYWSLTGFISVAIQIIANQSIAILQLFKKDFTKAKYFQWGVLMGFAVLMLGFLAYWSRM